MNILEFIETQYPIKDKVKVRLENPYQRIANSDDLPYDKIGPDEFGNVTKLVEVEDNRFISVMDLISMSADEVAAQKDIALQVVWDAYMSQIDLQDINIIDIMESVKHYQGIIKKREAQIGVLGL